MVTVAEARGQLEQRKTQLRQTQASIKAAQLARLTRAQLQERTRQQLAERQKQQSQLEVAKTKAREELKPAQEELERFESKVVEAEAVQAKFEKAKQEVRQAKKFAEKFTNRAELSIALKQAGVSTRVRQLALFEQKRTEIIEKQQEQLTDITSAGLSIDEFSKISPEDLSKLTEDALKTLQKAKLITVIKEKVEVKGLKPTKQAPITARVIKGEIFGQKVDIKPGKPGKVTVEERRRIEDAATFKRLVATGNIPAIVRKGFRIAGTEFFKLSDKVRQKIIGGEPLTKLELKRAGAFIGEVGLFGAFSPAFTTGAQTLDQVLQKSKFDALKGLDKVRSRFSLLENKLIRAKSLAAQKKIVREAAKKLIKTPEDKKIFARFIVELAKKRVLRLPKSSIFVTTKRTGIIARLPTTKKAIQQAVIEVRAIVPQITRTQAIQALAFSKLITGLFKSSTQAQQQLQAQKQKGLLVVDPFPIQKVGQRPKTTTGTVTVTATAPKIPKPTILQIPKVKGKAKPKLVAIPRPIPKLLKVPVPKGVKETSTFDKLRSIRERGRGVNVVVGQKLDRRKVIATNVHPFTGLKIGRKFVDRNIEASFRLIRSKKIAKGRRGKPFNIGAKFRPSKRNALFIVERRKFRLDMRPEKRQIKTLGKSRRRRLEL